jgi:4-carboxymuconolactone decarboxylase
VSPGGGTAPFRERYPETPVTDPYFVALDVLAAIGGDQNDERNRAAEVAPDFVKMAMSFAYGEILARPGLDLKSRTLVAVAAEAATSASSERLREHVAAALHLGWTKVEVIEVIIQTAASSGIPAALKALSDCHELLVERDPGCASCE